MPARNHLAVRTEAVPLLLNLSPLADNCLAVIHEVIPAVIKHAPTGSHLTARLKVIICSVYIEPAGMHLACSRIKIVPVIIDLLPACLHGAVICEMIPGIIYLGPSAACISVVGYIIIRIAVIAVAHAEPVVDNRLVILNIISSVRILLPFSICRDGRKS